METPPTSDPGVVFFLVIVGLIALAGVAYGVLLFARWNHDRIRYVAPARVRSAPIPTNVRRFTPVSPGETNAETPKLQTPSPAPDEIISLQETAVAEALARLIIAEKIGLTDAVKIGTGKKSGEGYQKWSGLVKAAIDRQQQPQYQPLNDQRQPV